MAEDLITILTRFHREVFLPDFERIVAEAFGRFDQGMKDHLEACRRRFDGLEASQPNGDGPSRPLLQAGGPDHGGI